MSTDAPIAVSMRCAKNGKGFYACLMRENQQSKYKLLGTVLVENLPSSVVAVARRTLPAWEFDFTGFRCPSCGDTGTVYWFIECDKCRGLVCARRTCTDKEGCCHYRCHDGCCYAGIIYRTIQSYDVIVLGSQANAVAVITEAVVVSYRY
jgi:hypothetical protein